MVQFALFLCIDAFFEFVQTVYDVPEATSPAVAEIRLASSSAVLGTDVSIRVTTLTSGTASGE